ncbi:MAG: hypothetical protein HYZ50_00845 [Deltaproteobacteria bacterium]|nr:hypothetical protein [Deltaproteobacteria bacterium]
MKTEIRRTIAAAFLVLAGAAWSPALAVTPWDSCWRPPYHFSSRRAHEAWIKNCEHARNAKIRAREKAHEEWKHQDERAREAHKRKREQWKRQDEREQEARKREAEHSKRVYEREREQMKRDLER